MLCCLFGALIAATAVSWARARMLAFIAAASIVGAFVFTHIGHMRAEAADAARIEDFLAQPLCGAAAAAVFVI